MNLAGLFREIGADIVGILLHILRRPVANWRIWRASAALRAVFLVPLTAGAMIAFSTRMDLQDGHDRWPPADWSSNAALSRNQPSNSCPLWQRSEYAITKMLHSSLPPGCDPRMVRTQAIRKTQRTTGFMDP